MKCKKKNKKQTDIRGNEQSKMTAAPRTTPQCWFTCSASSTPTNLYDDMRGPKSVPKEFNIHFQGKKKLNPDPVLKSVFMNAV